MASIVKPRSDFNPAKHTFRKAFENEWSTGKERQDKVKALIEESLSKYVEVREIGFGADSTKWVERKNERANYGSPDLGVYDRSSGKEVCLVEVTGGKTDLLPNHHVMINSMKVEYLTNQIIPKKRTCYYAHVYPNKIVVHDDAILLRHRFNDYTVFTHGVYMDFVKIPSRDCLEPSALVYFIKLRLGKV